MNDDTHDPTEPETPAGAGAEPEAHDAAAADVGDALAAAADGIDTGDPTAMLSTVHATAARRRRRRRNGVVSLAAVGTLVVSGVVVANLVGGDDGDDLIVSAPATEAPVDTEVEEDVADTVADTAPAATVVEGESGETAQQDDIVEVPSGETVPVRLVPASVDDVVDSGLTVDVANIGQTRLLRWQDGFLSIHTSFEPQPLPTELPEEIAEQFPPEVSDLFPDGLPPTIQEAMQILEDAGLLDEVTAIVTANQDVSDAIYAERGAVNTSVRFSTDGLEWTDLDVDFPVDDNYWNSAVTTSDRFVIVVNSAEGAGSALDGVPASPPVVDVYSSTDLVNWSAQQIPLPAAPAELGPAESFHPYVTSFAANDTGFLLSTQASTDIDPVQLLPAEVRDRVQSTSGGISYGYGDDGVTIEIFGDTEEIPDNGEPNPEVVEVLTFTWEELGLDGPPNEGGDVSTTYVATWDGEPTVVDRRQVGWLVGVGDQFVELGPEPQRSANGVDWTPITVPAGGFVDGIIETSDGIAIRMTDNQGAQTVYLGDLESGEWTPIDVPGLPENGNVDSWAPNVFVLSQYDDGEDAPPPGSVGTRRSVEVDGYRYEFEATHTDDEYSVTYTLTDIATGEIVVTESAEGLSGAEEPFEFVEDGFGGNQVTIVDPATGEPLVSIPYDGMTQELLYADGTTFDVSERFNTPPTDPQAPTHWVMASVDGGWIVEQISDGTDDSRWPGGAAVVDDVVLVAWSDGTFSRIAAT